MMLPVVPALVWLMAAALLILLLLVVFGYHLYQRSRLAALAADAGDVASLSTKKEQLEADIASMRAWLSEQQAELQKLDSERRGQELLRIELTQLERTIADRKKEAEASLKLAAGLEAGLVKKRNLLGRLEAEARELEAARSALEPARKELADTRAELERGKGRLTLLAEQEIRTGALQRQAEELARGLEDLKVVIVPLQKEKERLRAFIDQARNTVAIKSERVREQNAVLRELESACQDLKNQKGSLEREVAALTGKLSETQARLDSQREDMELADLMRQKAEARAEIARLAGEVQNGQASLLLLRERLEQAQAESRSVLQKERRPRRRAPARGRPRNHRPGAVGRHTEAIYQRHV